MNAYYLADKVAEVVNEEVLAPLGVKLTANAKRGVRQVIREGIPTNKWCKNDWITEVMRLNDDYIDNMFRPIKTIDTAIPQAFQKSLDDLGINPMMWVTVYYDGESMSMGVCMDIRTVFAEVDNAVRLGTHK